MVSLDGNFPREQDGDQQALDASPLVSLRRSPVPRPFLALCLFCVIFRLAPIASVVPVTHMTQRRDASGSNDPSLYQDSKRRNVGDDISNTFHDMVGKVKDVFLPSDDKKMTAVEVVSEYAYDELDHDVPLDKLKAVFEKLHEKMGHGNNRTDDGDWIYKQIRDTISGLEKTYDKADETEGKEEKHSVQFIRTLSDLLRAIDAISLESFV